MRIGIQARLGARSVAPSDLALLAEELGFESLFLPEHTHIPVTVLGEQAASPPEWLRLQQELLDPFVALGGAAVVTSGLRLGTGVCLVGLHDPILLAKTAATLDVLSHGRLLFGIGAGSHPDEARAYGVDPARRWSAAVEKLRTILDIWDGDGPVEQEPKPVQRPHPPLLVAAEVPGAGRSLTRSAASGSHITRPPYRISCGRSTVLSPSSHPPWNAGGSTNTGVSASFVAC
jgi:alkanesulfonate monooxygenase SsuD/methylene tetrahydromethanopterin reductase-like flavin-dependent oxidoreductase (luciferase family)